MARRFTFGWLMVGALVASAPVFSQLPTYLPGQEYRSLNTDLYEIAIQKNGRLDVTLVTGQPVFRNAFPMIWFDGEEKPEMLPIDGRWSARNPVKDALGQGQGMMLKRKTVEWYLRAYPTKPFFAVQAAYVNTDDKPVTVRALMPWCTGEPKKGGLDLGPGTPESILLEHGDTTSGIVIGGGRSKHHTAALNPASGRTLVAGFLTTANGQSYIETRRTEDAEDNELDFFRAVCEYDPPIVLQPGERLETDVLYLAVGEINPFEGLERFAAASGLASAVSRDNTSQHGIWFVNGEHALTVSNETRMLPEAADRSFVAGTSLKRLHSAPITSWESVLDYASLASRRYHVAPFLWTYVPPALDTAGSGMTIDQQRAYLTLQALLAGPIVLPGTPDTVSDEVMTIARSLSPTPDRPARPLDLFVAAIPSVFVLPVTSPAGSWHIAAVFNWEEAAHEFRLDFESLGLDPGTRYTTFDFWQGRYYGLSQGRLNVDVPPGHVRVLGFKRYENHPMVLSVDDHFTQGANSISELQWNQAQKRLSGALNAEAGQEYRMHVLVPAPYALESASHETHSNGQVVDLLIEAADNGPAPWHLEFR